MFPVLEDLQDLVESPGWKVVVQQLQARRTRHLNTLTNEGSTADLAAVRKLQAAIVEIDVLLRWPEQQIEEARAKLGRAAVPA